MSKEIRAGIANWFLQKGYLWPAALYYLQQCKEGYADLDVKGKVVLDIGADWGNSSLYWWLRGATKIIAYEANPFCEGPISTLQEQGLPIDFRGVWDGDYPDADVLKVDIEGKEADFRMLYLGRYDQWAFATHSNTFWMEPKLLDLGGRLAHEQDGERVWVKTL